MLHTRYKLFILSDVTMCACHFEACAMNIIRASARCAINMATEERLLLLLLHVGILYNGRVVRMNMVSSRSQTWEWSRIFTLTLVNKGMKNMISCTTTGRHIFANRVTRVESSYLRASVAIYIDFHEIYWKVSQYKNVFQRNKFTAKMFKQ